MEAIRSSVAQKNRGVFRVLLMSLLMMGLTLPAIWMYAQRKSNFFDATTTIWLMLYLCISIAGGGAIGFRVITKSWRQTVLASVLAGAGIMLISMFEYSPFYPGIWNIGTVDPDVLFFDLATFVSGTFYVSSPIFLLLLCDPAIIQTTFTPNVWKVLLTAFLVMVPFLCFDFIGFSYTGEGGGRVGLSGGFGLVPFILFIGVIAVLFGRDNQRVGNMFGTVGIVLEVLMFLVWALLWFGGLLG